ncbi:GNAT family N-acetyltransferase [Halobacillus sp. Cin3]|uniref:GNAT family N-acetyltransferase n=1 Tax=Halobacillus sp. Cin3 TaxID=2928441 RepID=UPI00248DB8DE|nr:GNAT family N-acetyltransferase [Halobacillus sp. Cin3]
MLDIRGVIRRAVPGDALQLEACMQKAYSVYKKRMNGNQLPPLEADYKGEIVSYPVWVLDKGDEILGGVILMFHPTYTQVANIAVDPDYQGHGLGRRLLGFAEEKSVERGCFEMRLATHRLLTENVAFYTSMGWEESGRDDFRIFFKKRLETT